MSELQEQHDADLQARQSDRDYRVSHPIATAIECIADIDVTEAVLMRIVCATLRKLEKSSFAHKAAMVTAAEHLEDAMFLLEKP